MKCVVSHTYWYLSDWNHNSVGICCCKLVVYEHNFKRQARSLVCFWYWIFWINISFGKAIAFNCTTSASPPVIVRFSTFFTALLNLFWKVQYKYAAFNISVVQVQISLRGHSGLLKIYRYPCFVQQTSVTSSWWSVLMLMSQQLAALILLALLAIISPPPPPPSSCFKAAAAAAACRTHFNTPDSFDRLYGLIILNIYRSHFPKPSMFIQHLGDHSTAPFSIPFHTPAPHT